MIFVPILLYKKKFKFEKKIEKKILKEESKKKKLELRFKKIEIIF